MPRIRDFVTVQGKSKIKAGNGLANGKYKFFTSSNTQSKWLNEYQYNQPSLIFGTGGMPSIHYCKTPFSTSTDCIVMYAKENANIEVIYHYLLAVGFHGAGLQHISKQFILDIEIPQQTEEVQIKVVSLCNRINNLTVLRKQQLAQLNNLVQARFMEMFGDPMHNEKSWELRSLDSVCSSIVDCPHSTPSYMTENTGYMCIRTSIVKKNQILWSRIEYIPENEYYQRIQRKRPQKGDIVYTREGAILGIAAMIDKDCNVALGQRSMLLSPNPAYCCSRFLCVAMNFDSFLHKALEGLGGSASPHINVGDIKSFQIIMPPIELQEKFSNFVEKSNEQRLIMQQSLDKLEMLKKSLMQKFFGGNNI